jgi:hypothetical protein
MPSQPDTPDGRPAPDPAVPQPPTPQAHTSQSRSARLSRCTRTAWTNAMRRTSPFGRTSPLNPTANRRTARPNRRAAAPAAWLRNRTRRQANRRNQNCAQRKRPDPDRTDPTFKTLRRTPPRSPSPLSPARSTPCVGSRPYPLHAHLAGPASFVQHASPIRRSLAARTTVESGPTQRAHLASKSLAQPHPRRRSSPAQPPTT